MAGSLWAWFVDRKARASLGVAPVRRVLTIDRIEAQERTRQKTRENPEQATGNRPRAADPEIT
ncbi:MAG: hypothetical protein CL933_03800 [Deltaproteobacteria bacterium]|nr:hypothetical protein [Deltaproteobacteria bacterium]